MRQHRILLGTLLSLATCTSAALLACASNEPAGEPSSEPSRSVLENDGGQTPDADAASDAVAPCTEDCEYYPPTCSSDALCPAGLFDSSKPAGNADVFDLRTSIHLIRGRSATDVWAMGPVGALARFDGTSWKRWEAPMPPASFAGRGSTFWAFWLREASEVGIVGLDSTFTRGLADPDVDAAAPPPPGGWTHRSGVAIGYDPTWSQDGQLLMTGWAAPGSDDLWLVTTSRNQDRSQWGAVPSGLLRIRVTPEHTLEGEVAATYWGSILGMHGSAADDFWGVGNGGIAMRVTGAAGGPVTTAFYNTQTRNSLNGVWAASANDVWAVGSNGTIRHYVGDPAVWDVVEDIPTVHLNAIWGSSPSDIWAVGNDAVVLHYDGTRWSRVKVGGLGGRRPDLATVWTATPGQVWVGGDGVFLSLGGTP